MKRILTFVISACAIAALSGCLSRKQHAPVSYGSELGAQTLPRASISVDGPQTQAQRAGAIATVDRPPAGYVPPNSRPLYNNPKIAKVILAPHIDKDGRMYGPQEMYQVAEEGGWNIDALEPGASGYIPSVNIEVPANIGNPVVAPARRAPDLPAGSRHLAEEIDLSRVDVTGLFNESDRAQAEAMASAKGLNAEWDEELGWILVPRRR